MGEKVQLMPWVAASAAAAAAPASTSGAFQLAAMPSGMGMMVLKP